MKMKRLLSLAAVTMLAGSMLSACSQGTTANKSSNNPDVAATSTDYNFVAIDAPMPAIPQGLEQYYNQEVSWESCGVGLQCAKIKVPLDYANPTAGEISLAMKKRVAGEKKIGTMLVNPGGPGGAGQELASSALYYFSQNLISGFDVLGFDPRGVGESTPIKCLTDDELGRLLEASYPDTEAGKTAMRKDADEVIAGCKAESGQLLPYVGTESAARDMDVIRHLVGDPKLYYVGYSYGTSLGGMYAELFPQNVGRLILDGAVSADASNYDQSAAQLKGFEDSLDAYLEDCLADGENCPFTDDIAAAREKITYLLDASLKSPIPTSTAGHDATQAVVLLGIITALYDNATWPILTDAFNEVFDSNTADTFMLLFDAYVSREGGKFTSNSIEANWAINCADAVPQGDDAVWEKQSEQLQKVAPLFGKYQGYDEYMCSKWPYVPIKSAGPYTAKGSDPIVVVGTVGDPATPYQWAQEFSAQLDNAVLVTYEGEGHTAYGRSTSCIQDPLDKYMLTGEVPDELTCPAK